MRVEIQGLRPLEDSDHDPGDRMTAYLEADPETALQDVLPSFQGTFKPLSMDCLKYLKLS